MKKRILVLLSVILVLSLAACSGKNSGPLKTLDDEHAEKVTNDLEVFESGNISDISERIFDVPADAYTDGTSSDGIIADLFGKAKAKVSAVDETTVTYTIVSPDISDFFTACADELDAITTSEELGQAILAYAETAPQKEYTVSVSYTITEEGIDVAYDNPDFINAMTGGLLDAYSTLYNQYLVEQG